MNTENDGFGWKTRRRENVLALLSIAVACVFSTGCFSFSFGGGSTVTKTSYNGGGLDPSAPNEVDEIRPEVRSASFGGLELRFKLIGSFTMEKKEITEVFHPSAQRLAFGFFPGSACDETTGKSVGTAMKSVWFNVVFAGMPTVSGLLVEPFIHAEPGAGSAFSRSAIFGFHRWGASPYKDESHDTTRSTESEMYLDQYECKFDGDSYYAANCICKLDPPSRKAPITISLSVDDNHPLKRQLAPFENRPMVLTIPKEQE